MRNPWWLGMLLVAGPALAAPLTVPLAPPGTETAFRAYGLGFLPIDGHFTRFTGTLTLDDQDPRACHIVVKAEAASLQMPDPDMTADAIGPDLLDVTRHPAFEFTGACTGPRIEGTLLLHGVAKPLSLAVTRDRTHWIASGPMRRAEWGMGARPNLAGPEVRIRFTVRLPPGFPAAP